MLSLCTLTCSIVFPPSFPTSREKTFSLALNLISRSCFPSTAISQVKFAASILFPFSSASSRICFARDASCSFAVGLCPRPIASFRSLPYIPCSISFSRSESFSIMSASLSRKLLISSAFGLKVYTSPLNFCWIPSRLTSFFSTVRLSFVISVESKALYFLTSLFPSS